jgi:hypothetical protein
VQTSKNYPTKPVLEEKLKLTQVTTNAIQQVMDSLMIEEDEAKSQVERMLKKARGMAVVKNAGIASIIAAEEALVSAAERQGQAVLVVAEKRKHDDRTKAIAHAHAAKSNTADASIKAASKIIDVAKIVSAGSPPAEQPRQPRGLRLHHTLVGRLGNQLFQHASTVGIATANEMNACVGGGDLATHFEGVDTGCAFPKPQRHVSENKKYATHNSFSFDGDAVLGGYLQSYKYFRPNIRDTIRLKPKILAKASALLAPFKSHTTVGIHVRHGDLLKYGYIQFPPDEYFLNVLAYFRKKYSDAQFVVASDSTAWCSKQPFFAAGDIRIVTEKHTPVTDLAILAGCDHTLRSFLLNERSRKRTRVRSRYKRRRYIRGRCTWPWAAGCTHLFPTAAFVRAVELPYIPAFVQLNERSFS